MISRRAALMAGVVLAAGFVPVPLAYGASWGTMRDGRVRLRNGRWLGYREYGNPAGPLVLYFHGIPGSRIEAALVAEEANQAGLRLVAIDRPGIGCSTYYACRRIVDWPQDVVEVVEQLGYGGSGFGILGFSSGAPYVLACVQAFPARLTHAAIVSGHTALNTPGVRPGAADRDIGLVSNHPRLSQSAMRIINRRLRRNPNRVIADVSQDWTAADRQLILSNPLYCRYLLKNLHEVLKCGSEGIVADVNLLAGPWSLSLCQINGSRISLWQGGCDTIAHPTSGHYFQKHLPGSELTIDPQAGHITMLKWHAPEILAKFV